MTSTPTSTPGETYFFRDRSQFDLLRFRLLPELIGRRRDSKILRLWSAGCSTGEEAYSLAMLVDMLLPEREEWDILILGTDIDEAALKKAQRGHYGRWSFRMVSPGLQGRYFRREGEEWELEEVIRNMASFRALDLIGAPFPDAQLRDMDLILCRNVFIYFCPEEVERVSAKMAAALREGGYLVTGHTELIGHVPPALKARLFAESVVYQKGEGARQASPEAREGTRPPPPLVSPVRAASPPLAAGTRLAGAGEGRGGGRVFSPACGEALEKKEAPLASARELADRGEYAQAEQACRKALAADPLAAQAHFLLAQLAQIKGDFAQAGELLNKTLYLDPQFVAAYLERAALYERAGEIPRAQAMRHAALDIVRAMPGDEVIEPYETTAGDLARWLAQWEHAPK